LAQILEPTDLALILPKSDAIKLGALVPGGEQIILDICDGVRNEAVIATNTDCGFALERLADTPGRFPFGSTVSSVLSAGVVAAIKWMVCNTDCCEGPCPCVAVTAAGLVFPPLAPGFQWTGTAIFAGGTPMEFAVSGLPSWATATTGSNYVKIPGTPTGAGSWTVSISATNCDGHIVVQQGVIS
jgi:hypothetical protein